MTTRPTTNYMDYIHEPNNSSFDDFPGEFGYPLIGNTIPFYRNPLRFAQSHYQKYGLLSKMYTAGVKSLMVLGPDMAQQVLIDPQKNFSSKMGFPRVERFFGNSLVSEDFEHHRHQRRIMQTAFKAESLKSYMTGLNSLIDHTLVGWNKDVGSTIKFFPYIKDLLLSVASVIFLGESHSGSHIRELNKAFLDCANGVLYVVPFPFPGNTVYKGLQGKKFLEQYLTPMVPRKRAGDGLDMLSHFSREKDEDGNFYSDQEIVSQMIFLMFAAHDTTTAAITHTIYYLARNPEVKQRLYEECQKLGKDSLEYEDLDAIPYMQLVFNEVLRIKPSIPIVPRRTVREVEMNGYKVPAHTMLMLFITFNHFMDDYWSDPAKFDPDRFSPERAEHKRHPFLYHPFGGGAHKCIGMHFSQMAYKSFMYKFLMKYDFEARHQKEPVMQHIPIPNPTDGMPIEMFARP